MVPDPATLPENVIVPPPAPLIVPVRGARPPLKFTAPDPLCVKSPCDGGDVLSRSGHCHWNSYKVAPLAMVKVPDTLRIVLRPICCGSPGIDPVADVHVSRYVDRGCRQCLRGGADRFKTDVLISGNGADGGTIPRIGNGIDVAREVKAWCRWWAQRLPGPGLNWCPEANRLPRRRSMFH